jgi:multiple sugar transport system ATP-binding protein
VRREVVARVDARLTMGEPELRIDGVTKSFAPGGSNGGVSGAASRGPALESLTLSVERGEIVVVVGPSGCGKSTALRIVAGLETPDAGTVTIAGRSVNDVPPQERDVAMVFQGYALYPQMTARQILEFPLKMRGVAAAERRRAVEQTAALLRIEPLLGRRPAEMSGGERQRVAMGRAIVREPRVFLFDEPLSNLDASLRSEIRLEIGQLVRRLGVTALYVTHDHVEAMTLGDRIAVLRAGKLLQVGTPREIYQRPASSFVATFLGAPRMNILPASGEDDGAFITAGPFRVPRPRGTLPRRFEVGIRPEDVRLGAEGVPGQILALEPLGAETHFVVRVGEHDLRTVARGFDDRRRGETVRISFDASRVLFFETDGDGARIE